MISLYKCPICNAERVVLDAFHIKNAEPPCRLCGHKLVLFDENYGRCMTGSYNMGLGRYALSNTSIEYGGSVLNDIR